MPGYKIDLFAIFIFLGIVQGIFLSTFFFSGKNRKEKANVFYGLLILSMTLCIVEIFLMYTGYIINCLYLVDFSEPISFVIGPCLLLMTYSITRESFSKLQYLHFLFALIYFILVIPFFLAPEDVKFNSWVISYKLDVPMRPMDYSRDDPRIFWLTDHHTDLAIFSLAFYGLFSLVEVVRVFRQKREHFFKTKNPVLTKVRAGVLQVVASAILIIIIKIFNPNDTGDHMFAAYVALVIYLTSFRVMKESGFFQLAKLSDPQKYKSSGISADLQQTLLEKLKKSMEEEKPFLAPDFSLPDLAKKLVPRYTPCHRLSMPVWLRIFLK